MESNKKLLFKFVIKISLVLSFMLSPVLSQAVSTNVPITSKPNEVSVISKTRLIKKHSADHQFKQTFLGIDSPNDITKLITFLTTVRSTATSGALFLSKNPSLNNEELPLSYYSQVPYWENFVCLLKEPAGTSPLKQCQVTDRYNSTDYTLTPENSTSIEKQTAALQIERINVANGTDIYDAACWQIALAVDALNTLSRKSQFTLTENQNNLLQLGEYANNTNKQPGETRATTKPSGQFSYHNFPINIPNEAYYYRMVPMSWLSPDPLSGITGMVKEDNQLPPPYKPGDVSWMDYKPITGENAWAFFLGPLQSAYLQAGKDYAKINMQSPAILNALNVLTAFSHMQSTIGAIYYAVPGSLGNSGSTPVNQYQVSVENNDSTLAGLNMLLKILQNSPSSSDYSTQIALIRTMIYGGIMPNGQKTTGILNFLHLYAYDKSNHRFYSGGIATEPNKPDWVVGTGPIPVDVDTWGVAAIGPTLISQWFGIDEPYNIWQSVKQFGGYYDGKQTGQTIWGVGYSDQDKHQIMSAEWTAGAINMVRDLIVFYNNQKNNNQISQVERSKVAGYVDELTQDQQSMAQHLLDLRSDSYPSQFTGNNVPTAENKVKLSNQQLAYEYASERYYIPFGWYANPIPSTTSTSWSIMLDYNFNPFVLGGAYSDPG